MDREELLDLMLEAIAGYRDLDSVGPSDSFAGLELEPGDIVNIVREVTGELDMELPRGYEYTQSADELVDFICG